MKPIVLNTAGAIALTLIVAGCVPSRAPMPAPAPTRPVQAPAPAPAPAPSHSNWMDAPATPGDWSYAVLPNGGAAQFGDAQSGPRFAIVCNRPERRISLNRSGSSTAAVPMTIRTEFGDRTLTASAHGTPRAELTATLSASDGFLDSMALTKGRFAVEIAGLPTLYLPAWGEVTRVIEDCR